MLTYTPAQDPKPKSKNRRRSVIWFNPPFSLSVKTKVGKEFLSLLDNSFPPDHPLHKIFSRNTVKLSYKRMPNMAQAVSSHNSKLLREDSGAGEQPGCNCRGGAQNCPVGGKCLAECVVYEATVTEDPSGKKETYTGVTSKPFKQRLYEHRADARKEEGRTKTALSAHIWSLKDQNIQHEVKWRIKYRGPD